MSRADAQLHLKVPAGLRDGLQAAAKKSHRSMNAEVVARLGGEETDSATMPAASIERHQLPSYPLRMTPELREQVEAAADTNGRSLNAEIVARLSAPLAEQLRDKFAALALPAIMDGAWPDFQFKPQTGLTPIENCAAFAYQAADAMLKARSA